MNTHRCLQYIKHRRKAKGRHGTHSPFVYALVEDCLQQNKSQPLHDRLLNHFKDWLVITMEAGAVSEWKAAVEHGIFGDRKQVFIVKGIHQSVLHSKIWQEICDHHKVIYSIDIFSVGLLVVNPEFKEKQHFLLKQ